MANPLSVKLKSLNRDLTFAAKGESGHWIMLDSKQDIGGNGAASSPMELVLDALGGCTGLDTLSILKKKRTPFTHLEMDIKGERRDEHPKSFTHIHIHFTLYSTGGEKALRDLEHAAELSHEKYCSVAAMLRNSVEITFDCEIIDE